MGGSVCLRSFDNTPQWTLNTFQMEMEHLSELDTALWMILRVCLEKEEALVAQSVPVWCLPEELLQ